MAEVTDAVHLAERARSLHVGGQAVAGGPGRELGEVVVPGGELVLGDGGVVEQVGGAEPVQVEEPCSLGRGGGA